MTAQINPEILGRLAERLTLLDQESGRIVPFVLNDEQRAVLQAFADCARLIVLKARQQGISTVCCLIDLAWAICHPGHNVAIVADTQEKAEALLAKCASWAKQLSVPITVDNVRTLTLANGASIKALSAVSRADGGESRVGRSTSYALVHLSELAFCANDVALFAALTSTLLPGGKVIVESTASPADNLFNSLWHDVDNGWRHVFFSVEAHAAYTAPEDSITDAEWADMQAKHGFTSRKHAAWWAGKLRTDLASDVYRALREYPPTPIAAFQFAEGRWIHDYAEANAVVVANHPVLKDATLIEVEYPGEPEPIGFGVDVGAGQGGDFSVLVGIGQITGRLHFVWMSNTYDVAEFAAVVIKRARARRPVAIVIESNGVGAGVLALVRQAGLECVEHESEKAEKAVRMADLRLAIESKALPIGPEIALEVKSSVVDRAGKYTGRDDALNAVSFIRKWMEQNPHHAPQPQPDMREVFVPKLKRSRSPARNL